MSKRTSMVPELRFPEFNDKWSKDVLSRLSHINPKVNELPDEFYYLDLESVDKGVVKSWNLIKKIHAPSRAQRILNVGDIIFQTVRPYQMNNYHYLSDKEYPVVASTGYAQIRAKQNDKFVYYSLHTKNFVNNVLNRCTGTSYPAINASDLGDIEICYPTVEEQQKIAKFLSLVDKQIELLVKKIELLEEQKRALLQKIFSQEIRFKSNDGSQFEEWKTARLIECLDVCKSGGTPKSTERSYYNGEFPFLSISDMTKQGKYIHRTEKSITQSGIDNSSAWLVKPNHIIYSMYASVGEVSINNIELCTSQAMLAILPKKTVYTEFLYYYLKSIKEKTSKFIGFGAQGNVNAQIVKQYEVYIPEMNEQKKIAAFLSKFDTLIDKSISQLEKVKELKKGLQMQLFI